MIARMSLSYFGWQDLERHGSHVPLLLMPRRKEMVDPAWLSRHLDIHHLLGDPYSPTPRLLAEICSDLHLLPTHGLQALSITNVAEAVSHAIERRMLWFAKVPAQRWPEVRQRLMAQHATEHQSSGSGREVAKTEPSPAATTRAVSRIPTQTPATPPPQTPSDLARHRATRPHSGKRGSRSHETSMPTTARPSVAATSTATSTA